MNLRKKYLIYKFTAIGLVILSFIAVVTMILTKVDFMFTILVFIALGVTATFIFFKSIFISNMIDEEKKKNDEMNIERDEEEKL